MAHPSDLNSVIMQPMRNLVIAIALLVGVIFIFTKLAEVQAIAETLRRGDWRFILLALGVETAWLINIAASWRSIYRVLGVEEEFERLILLSAAANFVNVVAPSGGVGGMAVFITEARRRGLSTARVTVAGVLFVLFDYAGFFCVLTLGLIVLFRRNNLDATELVATGILVAIAGFMLLVVYLGMRSASSLGRLLAGIAHRVNWVLRPFIQREYLSEARAHAFAHDMAEGLHQLRDRPIDLLYPAALGLSSKTLLVSILFLMFMAFKVPFSPGTLVAGFSIGYLFLIVSPTPAGIGVVEGALTLALRSLNVPLGAAAVIALSYRGITFWAPLLIGMLSFRWLSRSEGALPQEVNLKVEANPADAEE